MFNIYSIYKEGNKFTKKAKDNYIRKLGKINPSLKIVTGI